MGNKNKEEYQKRWAEHTRSLIRIAAFLSKEELEEISNIINRLDELTVKASNRLED